MPRRNSQDALFPKSSRFLSVEGLGFGLLISAFFALTMLIFNPDAPIFWIVIIAVVSVASSLAFVTRRILSFTASLIAVVLLVCIFTPILQPLEDALDITTPPVKADIIVALGGGMRCGAGQLEAASLARVVKAVELWRAGFAPRITLSKTAGLWPDCPSISSVAAKIVTNLAPSPTPQIDVLEGVSNTRDEAERVAVLAKQNGWQRVLIVTSPTHSRRALATFKQLGLNASVVAASEPRFDGALRLPFDRMMALPALTREVAGLVKYTLFGWF